MTKKSLRRIGYEKKIKKMDPFTTKRFSSIITTQKVKKAYSAITGKKPTRTFIRVFREENNFICSCGQTIY